MLKSILINLAIEVNIAQKLSQNLVEDDRYNQFDKALKMLVAHYMNINLFLDL